jgi:hypothetical protein
MIKEHTHKLQTVEELFCAFLNLDELIDLHVHDQCFEFIETSSDQRIYIYESFRTVL